VEKTQNCRSVSPDGRTLRSSKGADQVACGRYGSSRRLVHRPTAMSQAARWRRVLGRDAAILT
jgi:hypothetical protein